MIFTESDHARLATLFDGVLRDEVSDDRDPYAGYRPTVRELPNGDGKVDVEKKFLHVALKYNPPAWALAYLARAHFEACRVATALGVPAEYRPHEADATLRVLEYPAGAGSAEHVDMDLFSILCWRSTPGDLVRRATPDDGATSDVWRRRYEADCLSPGLHIGELGELVGLGPATPHRVPARSYTQRSIVYFALPSHDAVLPSGATVGAWLAERVARSRVYA